MPAHPARVAAPPLFLEPLLAFIERVDRRRLGIRPIRRGGVSGFAWTRHHGEDVLLRDGTLIRDGDRIGALHVNNVGLADLTVPGWQSRMYGLAREDARALAAWARRQPPGEAPRAYWGATILWPLMKRMGAEVRERPQTFRVRLEDWYLRGVLRRWSKAGTRRLEVGRGGLRTMDCWLSANELERRYGDGRTATRAD